MSQTAAIVQLVNVVESLDQKTSDVLSSIPGLALNVQSAIQNVDALNAKIEGDKNSTIKAFSELGSSLTQATQNTLNTENRIQDLALQTRQTQNVQEEQTTLIRDLVTKMVGIETTFKDIMTQEVKQTALGIIYYFIYLYIIYPYLI